MPLRVCRTLQSLFPVFIQSFIEKSYSEISFQPAPFSINKAANTYFQHLRVIWRGFKAENIFIFSLVSFADAY